MKSKDELDILIKDLSEKQQNYKTSQDESLETNYITEVPELIPVDFDLNKNLQEEAPVAVTEEIIQIEEQSTFLTRFMQSIRNFSFKKKFFNFDIKNSINKMVDFVKRKPGMSVFLLLSFVTIFGFTIFSAGCSIFASKNGKPVAQLSGLNKEQEADSTLLGADRINILLLGIDSPKGKFDERSDTIILLSLDVENAKISALSIPRDSYVTIPGHGKNKINAANEIGGPDLVVKTISNLLAVQIDYYAVTNFNGFIKIIDTLGGVELDVEKNMYYRTYNGTINLKKGLQHLDGDKALQYVRFRHDALGDISRTQRQQKFMLALAKEVMKPQTILKLPKLLPEVSAAVKTDLSLREMISLVSAIKGFDLKNINTQTLPGNFVTIKGISYWYVDEAQAKQVVMDVFVGKTNDEIIDPNLQPNISDPTKKKNDNYKSQTKAKNNTNPTVNKDSYPKDTVNSGTYEEPIKQNQPVAPQNPLPGESTPDGSQTPSNNTEPVSEQPPTEDNANSNPNQPDQGDVQPQPQQQEPSTTDQVY